MYLKVFAPEILTLWKDKLNQESDAPPPARLALSDLVAEAFSGANIPSSVPSLADSNWERIWMELSVLREAAFDVLERHGSLTNGNWRDISEIIDRISRRAELHFLDLRKRQEVLEREFLELLERSAWGEFEDVDVQRFLEAWLRWTGSNAARLVLVRDEKLWRSFKTGDPGILAFRGPNLVEIAIGNQNLLVGRTPKEQLDGRSDHTSLSLRFAS